MKHPTKVDRWLTIVLAISALVLVSIAVFGLLNQGIASLAAWVPALLVVLTTGAVAAVSLPTYYEVQSDRLFIRSGLLRWTVPLDEIVSVTPTSNPLGSPAWSLDRLEVRWRRGGKDRTLLISPLRRDEFLRELQARASALVLEGDVLRRRRPQ
ncbi:MAG TPA: PH domain-containing protein [Blastocatellia bacterium]|nr:PH domain-containing protein [Blastocatellia bacterium]